MTCLESIELPCSLPRHRPLVLPQQNAHNSATHAYGSGGLTLCCPPTQYLPKRVGQPLQNENACAKIWYIDAQCWDWGALDASSCSPDSNGHTWSLKASALRPLTKARKKELMKHRRAHDYKKSKQRKQQARRISTSWVTFILRLRCWALGKLGRPLQKEVTNGWADGAGTFRGTAVAGTRYGCYIRASDVPSVGCQPMQTASFGGREGLPTPPPPVAYQE